jgi:transposase InsO family protein
MPELKPERRPKTFLTEDQKQAIRLVFEDTKLSARLLYHELRSKGHKIPKNKLYRYMKLMGWVIPNPRKQKKRKRCRYERKHSGSLIHGDWHRSSIDKPHCIIWEDDASRKIIAGGEYDSPNAENSIKSLKQGIEHATQFNLIIREVNTDRGSCFVSNKEPGTASFQKFLAKQGIRHVLSRVNNPQTNGKVERLWLEYDRHRWRFETFQEWANWYNNRLHGALNLEWGETPNEAFQRKMPQETILGWLFK